ncbi:MAG: hypothetical protein ACX94B_12930 [Henriciella sp.]
MSEEEDKRRIPYLRDIIVALGSGAMVVLGQMVMAGPQQTTADAELIRSISERLQVVEDDNQRLRVENTQLQIKVASLELSVTDEVNLQQIVCDILEAKPGKDWAKLVVERDDGRPSFVMWCLDTEYRAAFNVGAFEYLGLTDDAFWEDPKTVAEFYANDLAVYRTRRPLLTYETWETRGGVEVTQELSKYYMRLEVAEGIEPIELIMGHLPRRPNEAPPE